jgi:hypothetical protein
MPYQDWGYLPGIDEGALKAQKDIAHAASKHTTKVPVNLKYPLSVGEGFDSTYTNYNTHDSSEYAIQRSAINPDTGERNNIDEETSEPFVFFEFMEIASVRNMGVSYGNARENRKRGFAPIKDKDNEDVVQTFFRQADSAIASNDASEIGVDSKLDTDTIKYLKAANREASMFEKALRVYGGSIAMYMPTDIQINDQIVYNENSRRTFGSIQGALSGDMPGGGAVGTNTAVLAGLSYALTEGIKSVTKKLGKEVFSSFGSAAGGLAGAAGAGIIQDEHQRSTGEAKNMHEYMAYQSTGMRSFSFNFTILPDNKKESDEAALIIKQFRLAAHAYRNDAYTLTVPDHVIVSFHGAQDMIQLPPVVIEAVNVSYNPNNTSFFRYGNAPVEIGLALTLKEIVPLYRQNVEEGF